MTPEKKLPAKSCIRRADEHGNRVGIEFHEPIHPLQQPILAERLNQTVVGSADSKPSGSNTHGV